MHIGHPRRRVLVTAQAVVHGLMSLDDRDYYREDLARKRGIRPPVPLDQRVTTKPGQQVLGPTPLLDRMIDALAGEFPSTGTDPSARLHRGMSALRRRRPHLQWLMGTVLVLMLVATVLAAPPMLTSRCTSLSTWQHQPIACWRYSWTALVASLFAH
jgi:hypothetical protein